MGYPNTVAAFPDSVAGIGNRVTGLSPNGHAGPTSYAVVVVGTNPVTAGDVLQASEFGLRWIEHVFGGVTSDGLYEVRAANPTSGPVTSLSLQWIDLTSGLEVAALTDLSGSVVNLWVIGR